MKGESEMEETKERVKVRSAAATEVPLAQRAGGQIARLMAALTRAEQGSCPASAPNSLGIGVMGEDAQTGTLLSAQAPTMVRLAWANHFHLQLLGHNREGVESPVRET